MIKEITIKLQFDESWKHFEKQNLSDKIWVNTGLALMTSGVTYEIVERPKTIVHIVPPLYSQDECEHRHWERGRCEDCGYDPNPDEEYGC